MQKPVKNSRNADKFVVRLPDGMRDRLANVAREHHRSMNSEIVARMERSLSADEAENGDATTIAIYLPDSVKVEVEELARVNERGFQAEVLYRLKRIASTVQLTEEQGRMISLLQRQVEQLQAQLEMKGAA